MTLNVAANYGGRWDVVQAARKLAAAAARGDLSADDIDHDLFDAGLMTIEGPPEAPVFRDADGRIIGARGPPG